MRWSSLFFPWRLWKGSHTQKTCGGLSDLECQESLSNFAQEAGYATVEEMMERYRSKALIGTLLDTQITVVLSLRTLNDIRSDRDLDPLR